MMTEFVGLRLKRNRRLPPWPEDFFGLDPMYGRMAGVARAVYRNMTGSARSSCSARARSPVGWVPNWRFDLVCVDRSLAERIREKTPNVANLLPTWSPRSTAEPRRPAKRPPTAATPSIWPDLA